MPVRDRNVLWRGSKAFPQVFYELESLVGREVENLISNGALAHQDKLFAWEPDRKRPGRLPGEAEPDRDLPPNRSPSANA